MDGAILLLVRYNRSTLHGGLPVLPVGRPVLPSLRYRASRHFNSRSVSEGAVLLGLWQCLQMTLSKRGSRRSGILATLVNAKLAAVAHVLASVMVLCTLFSDTS